MRVEGPTFFIYSLAQAQPEKTTNHNIIKTHTPRHIHNYAWAHKHCNQQGTALSNIWSGAYFYIHEGNQSAFASTLNANYTQRCGNWSEQQKKKHNKSLLCKTSHALSPNNNKWKSVLQEKRAADWRMRW